MADNQPNIRSERVYVVDMIPTAARFERADDFAQIVPEHLAWVAELQRAGVIRASGPLVDEASGDKTGYGLFLLRAGNAQEAAEIVEKDPQVITGFKRYELRPWLMRQTL